MNFDAVFSPKSIALIGASRDEQSVGYNLFKNIISPAYKGTVYPVNPKTDELLGKKVFHTIQEIPETPELAIIAIPAPYVQKCMEELDAKGVKQVIVISAGFKEAGNEGRSMEESLRSFCEQKSIVLIGPNCLGILNPHFGLNASFETVLPQKGSISFISQSGALISSVLDIANSRRIGFAKIVSVGNKALTTEHELLPYLFADEQTSVILLYAEVLQNAELLISLLRKNQQSLHPKPVILLKAGISTAGQKASSSHTGSLAGSDAAYQALIAQSGIIRVNTINELLSAADFFANSPLPQGNRIAIVTNAGGPGIIATDEAERTGLILAGFTEDTKKILSDALPPSSHVANPVDVLGDATSVRYKQALRAVCADSGVDSVLTIVTPQSMTDIKKTAEVIVDARNAFKKPVAASFIGEPVVAAGVDVLNEHGLPHMQFPEDGIQAISHASSFFHSLQKKYSNKPDFPVFGDDVHTIVHDLIQNNVQLVNTETVFTILTKAGIPVVKNAVVQSKLEAEQIGKQIGKTLVFKIISPDISHKTDVGGVILNVAPENAGTAFDQILHNISVNAPMAKTHGVLVSEMVQGDGLEMILGIKRETGLGTLIMIGLGGVYVEILKDTAFRFAPLVREDVYEMLESLKAKPVLDGFRGSPKRDIECLVDVVLHLSHLAIQIPEIEELDINPFYLKKEGERGIVLDARIVFSRK